MNKKRLIGYLFVTMSVGCIQAQEQKSSVPEYKLWYDCPAQVRTEALPLGNGRLGAMVYGTPGTEQIQLNEESIWAGRPNNNANPDALEYIPKVRELVFAGKFEEEKEELPYRMMPGPKAKYRCCVYKEREIVRQRIRLAEGKSPQGAHNNLVVQVVQAACEDCPISRYVVTDNCQKCMGKACQQSCNFGAIDIGRTRAHIDPQKCRECGKCAAACPYNAIADLIRPCRRSCPVGAISMDENGICIIDEKKCIQCGRCIHSCPFGAISSKSCVVDVCQAIVEKKHVYAMFAPSTEGQFGEGITFESWRNALKEVGFTDLVEVGLGGDMTAYAEAAEWAEAYRDGKKMTTSCCPGFVNLIRLHYPDLLDHISTTVSPMCAVSRWIKSKDPEAITVFVGPCIAKKSEVIDQDIPGSADYAMTYGEIRAIIRAKGITIHEAEETNQQSSTFGKWFGNSGGVTDEAYDAYIRGEVYHIE